MSIESGISIASYSDRNTFATPIDDTCAIVESFNKNGLSYRPTLLSSLLYRIAGKGLIELVYSPQLRPEANQIRIFAENSARVWRIKQRRYFFAAV